jgi:cell division protein FtsW (lipid II flippase)
VRTPAGLALPVALGAFLWVGSHLVGTPYELRSLVLLGVLGLLALAVPRLEVELAAALVAVGAAMLAIPQAPDASVSLAVHLTVAGALVTLTALLHRDHRDLAWLGGLLLASATWVRLYDIGVQAPEAYTLPSALVLLLAGLDRMRRSAEVSSVTALLAGLSLAVVPTLLWALVDPLSDRAVVSGSVCLLFLVGGAALRWTAPVVVGWLGGGALVLRELAPYAAQTPQWVIIAVAGSVLMAAGITWEARVRDLRRTAAYLGRLR